MSRTLVLLYGIVSYAVGLGGLTAFMLWVGGWEFLPRHINSGTPGPLGPALAINLSLVILFGLQHSIMARPKFKEALAKVISPAAERSTYVLLSGVFMLLFCFYWQPVAGTLWNVQNEGAAIFLRSFHVIGWLILVGATFEIDHFELMGLKQVLSHFAKRPHVHPRFTERLLYRVVRHPIQLGVLIGVWVTPFMTGTVFMLAVTMTIYIFVGLHFEEKALRKNFGDVYTDYCSRVPKVIPFTKFS